MMQTKILITFFLQFFLGKRKMKAARQMKAAKHQGSKAAKQQSIKAAKQMKAARQKEREVF